MKNGPNVRRAAHLPQREQRALDRLVSTRGDQPTADLLGVSVTTVQRLSYGGGGAPAAVARVARALEERAAS